ncbi:cytochrome c oxidase subunit 3 [Methylobacterium nodulans]|uniref:Cytochrome c oxidase subunit III n=1 Tax=Methylobacterium nodulans (strain LMG 21967 / CNCM I-2342 / ORS 2060) TaxID=460265 RepID=B8IBC0_METNO|nr:cytochrome c oxidase subunit 3 [Methylobacterium nodulans]ACL57335.1 cytochrome c oxidase subunit III [Methylobacterium nodulans ORS 2060]
MSIVLLYLAALGIVSARWLARQRLTAKPWLGAGPALAFAPGGPTTEPAKVGLGFFLAAVGLLFALLIGAYGMRVPPGAPRIQFDPWFVWLTTGLLGLASLALHVSGSAARRGERNEVRAGLLVAGVATLGFLSGQGLAWRLLWEAGAGRTPDAAGSFFYLITVLHGLHLAGGLVALACVTVRAMRETLPTRVAPSIGLCALYWDALLAIWLVLFGLLFRTPWSGLIDVLCRPA